jgi:hypothetical protein
MAVGDAAAAAGLKVFPSSQDRRLGYENDNYRGDELAALMARVAKFEAKNTNFFTRGATALSIPANTPTRVTNLGTPLRNTGIRSFDRTTGLVTMDHDGDYQLVFAMGSAGGLQGGQAFFAINGDASSNYAGFQDGPANATSVYITPLRAGDTFRPMIYATAAGSVDASRTSLSIKEL